MIYSMIGLYTALISAAPAAQSNVTVEKEIQYKKEMSVDFSGSNVSGDGDAPPAFFITKKATPNAASLLQERLNFKIVNYNEWGQ